MEMTPSESVTAMDNARVHQGVAMTSLHVQMFVLLPNCMHAALTYS